MSIDLVENFNSKFFKGKKLAELKIYEYQIQLNFSSKNYIHIESKIKLITTDKVYAFIPPYNKDPNINLINQIKNKKLINIYKTKIGTLILKYEADICLKIFKNNSPYYESYQIFTDDGDWHVE